ncbi:MAG: DUF3307 domain-containing protein [Chloroflexota bacterium]
MFLAHLVGDYILQTDELAAWKSKSALGVLVHCLVVAVTTFLFAFVYGSGNGQWWMSALIISLAHTAIDLIQLPISSVTNRGMLALARFLGDQTLHFASIVAAITFGGYISDAGFFATMAAEIANYPILAYCLAYTSLAMPAWVWLEFFGYGIAEKSPPNFANATNKYISSLERWLIATCVLLGQYFLIPVVAAPRVYLEKKYLSANQTGHLYIIKLLASVGLALGVGLALKQM